MNSVRVIEGSARSIIHLLKQTNMKPYTWYSFFATLALVSACSKEDISFTENPHTHDQAPGSELMVVESFSPDGELILVDEFDKTIPAMPALQTRSVNTTGIVLVISLTTDNGTSLFTTSQVRNYLQETLQDFWQWHLPTQVDYSKVIETDLRAPGMIPTNYSMALDFVEETAIAQAFEMFDLTFSDVRHTIVLLPPGDYGFDGAASSRVVIINSQIPENRLLFTLAHELGHNYGLNHSQQAKFNNCEFGPLLQYGGDDVMGGLSFKKLNPWHLLRLNMLQTIPITLPLNSTQVVWLDPLDEEKSAIRVANRHFIYHRKENQKGTIVEGSLRRHVQRLDFSPVKMATVDVKMEGRSINVLTDFKIRVCTQETVLLDQSIQSAGSFQIPIPQNNDFMLWIDADDYLATSLKISATDQNEVINILLKCGDTTSDGVISQEDIQSATDINLDGVVDSDDIKLIMENMGSVQDEPSCSPYILNAIDYEIVFGKPARCYRYAGIDLETLFPGAIGRPTDDAIWIQLKKVPSVCF